MRWGGQASERFRHVDLVALDGALRPQWRRRLRASDQALHVDGWRLAGATADGRHAVVALDSPHPVAGTRTDTTPIVVSVGDGAPHDGEAAAAVAPAWTTFDTGRLLVRGVVRDGRWIGVLTAPEAARLASAEARAQGWRPEAFGAPDAGAAYGVWTARIGDDGQPEASTLRPLDTDRTFPGAGILVGADGTPVAGAGATAWLVARDTRLVLVRIDVGAVDPLRVTPLPQAELALAVASDDGLVLYGHAAPPGTSVAEWPRHGVFSAIGAVDGSRIDRSVADLFPP
jgi:hypothetical protein